MMRSHDTLCMELDSARAAFSREKGVTRNLLGFVCTGYSSLERLQSTIRRERSNVMVAAVQM